MLVGGKVKWPELMGLSGGNAKKATEKDNPYVTAMLIPMGKYMFGLMNMALSCSKFLGPLF